MRAVAAGKAGARTFAAGPPRSRDARVV